MHSMSGSRSTVLVIEDHAALRRLIREEFELAGFEVYGAENGADGLKSAACHSPRLITIDLDPVDMSGGEVLDRLRSSSRVPVSLLSARSAAPTRCTPQAWCRRLPCQALQVECSPDALALRDTKLFAPIRWRT
jgi:CheY-like chemotaxis protein